mgnify:CR=1 FL=1
MDIKQFKPKNIKRSDKFSANLFKFMRKNESWGLHVYSPQIDWNMNFQKFNYDDPRTRSIYIGFRDDQGWLVGRCLADIICADRNVTECYAYSPGKDDVFYRNMIEISDWFFTEYARIGRALWDKEGANFMIGSENRFTIVGNTKRCNWSGRWYEKKITKKQTTERKEKWVIQS